MRELPIIFCSDMVRAILEDRKTHTRRIIEPQPKKIVSDWSHNTEVGDVVIYRGIPCKIQESRGRNKRDSGELTPVKIKPKCQVGDRLYIREAFQTAEYWCEPEYMCIAYKADLSVYKIDGYYQNNPVAKLIKQRFKLDGDINKGELNHPGPWRPSIHMPKWAARIWLEVTGVRVERLQDISEEDAKSEGIESTFDGTHIWFKNYDKKGVSDFKYSSGAISSFRMLWDSLNAKRGYPWKSNPWVWVIEFKKIKKPSADGRHLRAENLNYF